VAAWQWLQSGQQGRGESCGERDKHEREKEGLGGKGSVVA